MQDEVWKPINIAGYEGIYEVSNVGRVRRAKPAPGAKVGYILKQRRNKQTGYMTVMLWNYPSFKTVTIHRLVAQAFIPNPLNKPHINHIDENRANNCLANLEWCTHTENMRHSRRLHPEKRVFSATARENISRSKKAAWAQGKYVNRKARTTVTDETRSKLSSALKEAWAQGRRSRKASAKTRAKLSAAAKGRTSWRKGRTGVYSPETIERMRQSATGNKRHLGHRHSEETKRKISESKRRHIHNQADFAA